MTNERDEIKEWTLDEFEKQQKIVEDRILKEQSKKSKNTKLQNKNHEEDLGELLKKCLNETIDIEKEQEKKIQNFEALLSSSNEEDMQTVDEIFQQFELELKLDEYESQFYSDYV